MPSRLSIETRWAIIHEWKRIPQSDRVIAKTFSTSHSAVRKIINTYQQTSGVTDLPRRGRPRKLKEGVVTKMLHRNNKSSTRVLARKLEREGKGEVSHMTVCRQAKREEMWYGVRRRQPRLVPANKVERLAFAQTSYPRGFWKRVVASDEKVIELDKEVRGEWVKKGEQPRARKGSKFRPGVKFWAASSLEGKTPLYFLPKSMKGWEYLDFIKEKVEADFLRLYPSKRNPPVWLQDRDGMHTATVVQNYLKKSPLIPLQHWPSHSPDLNWQENVWEMVEQGVRKRNPTTIRGLKRVVEEEWGKIDIAKIRNCVSSMEARLEAVIAAHGGNTKY
jgi:transposase